MGIYLVYFGHPNSMASVMSIRLLSRAFVQPRRGHTTRVLARIDLLRGIRTSSVWRDRSFTNILADEIPPPVQINSIAENGIMLEDGLLLPSSCILHDGNVFLWDVPQKLWEGWETERFEFFESIIPRPGIDKFYASLSLTFLLRRNSAFWYRQNVDPTAFSHTLVSDQSGNPA